MPEIIIRTAGDIYKLFKQCHEFQNNVDEVQEEYDSCGYIRGKYLMRRNLGMLSLSNL